MKRRDFITLIGAAAAAWPLAARAQQSAVPVIGYMDTASASTTAHFVEAFRRGLSAAGYDEGRNVAIEYRWSDGDYDRLPALAAELVRRQVAVIATINTPTILAAKAATQTIPVIFGVGVDPIKFGLVASLNHPGGNLTGVTQLNIEMEAKRVQLLHELVPGATSIALLINPTSPAYSEAATESAQSAAQILGVRLLVLNASTEEAIEAAFVTLVEERAEDREGARPQRPADAACHRRRGDRMMKRREFISLLGGAAAAWPLAAHAQQLARRIGMLETIPPASQRRQFRCLALRSPGTRI